jgi:hypothetical protein
MEEFLRKFIQLNGVGAKVVIEHCLFDRQAFLCDALQTINDDERVGLVLKGQNIFMYKQNVKVAEIQDNMYKVSDGRLEITINVNKL